MAETLFDRLRQLRQRARQLLSLYGVSWIVAVVLSATLVVGLTDWLVHLDDPGVRLILASAILAAGGWTAWRFLVGPIRRTFSDLDLALRIEKRFPGFRDGLASTVQFMQSSRQQPDETDDRVGSHALQRRVSAATL